MVWLMSKHSIRLIAGSFNTAASAVKTLRDGGLLREFSDSAVAAFVRAPA